MSVSPARKLAFETLLKVEQDLGFAPDLLRASAQSTLKDADRRLATEIVMGTLRWRGELDFQIEQRLARRGSELDPEIRTALRMTFYQFEFLDKIPAWAAVHDAVELVKMAGKRSAAGLVNAVLRKSPPPKLKLTAADALPAALRSYPAWLLARWERHYGRAAAEALAWAAAQSPPTVLRVLGGELEVSALEKKLASQGVRTRRSQLAPGARRVESGDHAGLQNSPQFGMVIQDEASQLVPLLLAARPGQRVLDLAAAPGIKTVQIAEAMGQGWLVAADRSGRRLRAMRRLWPQLAPPNVPLHAVRLDASRPLPFAYQFDRVLADVPCSGTGTLARNPEIKWRLQESDFSRLARTQAAILRQGLESLAPGGRLVYSTCSLEPEENEAVVEAVLSEAQNFRRLARAEFATEFPFLSSLFDAAGYFRTRPDLHGTDGFFAAVILREC